VGKSSFPHPSPFLAITIIGCLRLYTIDARSYVRVRRACLVCLLTSQRLCAGVHNRCDNHNLPFTMYTYHYFVAPTEESDEAFFHDGIITLPAPITDDESYQRVCDVIRGRHHISEPFVLANLSLISSPAAAAPSDSMHVARVLEFGRAATVAALSGDSGSTAALFQKLSDAHQTGTLNSTWW